MTFTDLIKSVHPFVARNSPSLLSGVAIVGTVTTAVLAVRATPDALKTLELDLQAKQEPLTKVEVVRATWKFYIPATLTGVTTIACIVEANTISLKRNAILAGAYALSEAAAAEYKAKVLETIGAKKEQVVREKVAEDRLAQDKDAQTRETIVISGEGDELCYDLSSDRYFTGSIEGLRRIENQLNKRLLAYDVVTVNELYSMLGLGHTSVGDDMGWVSDNLIEFIFSSIIAPNGKPALVLDYRVDPRIDILRRGF